MQYAWEVSVQFEQINILRRKKQNTADMKGIYVSEFIHGGVYDETCG